MKTVRFFDVEAMRGAGELEVQNFQPEAGGKAEPALTQLSMEADIVNKVGLTASSRTLRFLEEFCCKPCPAALSPIAVLLA